MIPFEHLQLNSGFLTSLFHIDLDFANKVLKKAVSKGAEFGEIYLEYKVSNSVVFSENKLKNTGTGITSGFGIRTISEGKTAYCYSDDFSEGSFLKLADSVSNSLKSIDQKTIIQNFTRKNTPHILQNDSIGLHTPTLEKVDQLKLVNDYARSKDQRVEQLSASLNDSTKFIVIINSEGLFVEDKQSIFGAMVNVSVHDNGKRDGGHSFFGGRDKFSFLTDDSFKSVSDEAVRQAIVKLDAVPVQAGEQQVVINKGWGGVLVHEAVGHGLEGDFIRKETSLYTGKIGQKVASDKVTIIDDGSIKNHRGSLNVDDEGNPTQKNTLIENGELKGFIYDKLNADLTGNKPTGNGRRESFRSVPMPRMTNTYIDNGSDDPEELIHSVKKGIYCKSLGGGQVDITNGNFVFDVSEGYLIENGKLTQAVKFANLIGNGPDAMKKVTGVGNDLQLENSAGMCGKSGQSVVVGVGQPTILVDKMTVGGTEI